MCHSGVGRAVVIFRVARAGGAPLGLVQRHVCAVLDVSTFVFRFIEQAVSVGQSDVGDKDLLAHVVVGIFLIAVSGGAVAVVHVCAGVHIAGDFAEAELAVHVGGLPANGRVLQFEDGLDIVFGVGVEPIPQVGVRLHKVILLAFDDFPAIVFGELQVFLVVVLH